MTRSIYASKNKPTISQHSIPTENSLTYEHNIFVMKDSRLYLLQKGYIIVRLDQFTIYNQQDILKNSIRSG